MKKILVLLIMCFIPFLVFSDVAPSDMHPVDNCVRFTNLDEYPEITILGYIVGPTYDSPQFFEIQNGKCLDKGYKFNDLGLYWAQKKYVDSIGIENIVIKTDIGPELWGDAYFKQVTNDPNIFFITSAIDPGDIWVPDYETLKARISDYEIAGFVGDQIIIYLSKQIQYFSPAEEEIVEYNFPEIPNLKWSPFGDTDGSSSDSSQNK